MKKIFCFILITLMLFSIISVTVYAENADARSLPQYTTLRAGGGGSSGGGGGSSGGSSNTRHPSGRQPTLFESILSYIMMPFILFSSSIVFYFQLSKRSRKAKKLMKQMKKSDNAWKYNYISNTVEDGFYAIQNAWTNMDMSTASQYMSNELREDFQTKLNWMEHRNQRNVLEDVKLLKALPVAVHDDVNNDKDFVWFYIKGRMIDYTIDTNTQLVTEGSTSAASFVEYWQFVRKNDNWVLNKILQKHEENQIPFVQ